MPENAATWWARRQWSKGTDVPYPIGTYRSEWARYPMLIRQYRPDLNSMITLTQIPPAAEVYLVWQCDVGHTFVATPEEQRQRPGPERRRSSWCPDCAAMAVKRSPPRTRAVQEAADPVTDVYAECGHPRDHRRIGDTNETRCHLCQRLDSAPVTREQLLELVSAGQRADLAVETGTVRRYRWACPRGHGSYEATIERMLGGRRCRVCTNAASGADRFAVGDAFHSALAPKPASAVEADLRQRLGQRFAFDLSLNAVKIGRPFFNHVEVWPDFAIAELRVAIEYDSIGRHGLEHVGKREEIDRRKDRLLRSAGWEVVRIRTGKLLALGPFDLVAGSVTNSLLDRLDDQLSLICGDLMVAAYRR